MKMNLLFLILFLLTIISYAQQKDPAFSSLDKKTIMPLLFKNGSFNARGEYGWKPSMALKMEEFVSDDGNCYTQSDTLIYFKGKDPASGLPASRASVVFTTSPYHQGTKMDCHVCAPVIGLATFTKNNQGSWRLDQFHPLMKAHGEFGIFGKLKMERFSDDLFCLKVIDHYSGQGNYGEYTTLYSLSGQHNIVLEFESYATNDGTAENDIYHRTTRIRKQGGVPLSLDLITVSEENKATTHKKYRYSKTTEAFELIGPKGKD